MNRSLDDVRNFWERNPLFTGESRYEPGTKEFFDEHRATVINDCFAGGINERIFPSDRNRLKVLDLGCGPGFWTVELALRGCNNVTAADLTNRALELTERRCKVYGVKAELSQQNAQSLTFKDGTFSHVNCMGVIHHTPDTDACIREIARVLTEDGTASISVYYQNLFLRAWPLLKYPAKIIYRAGGGLRGRGRENIFAIDDVNEIVRLYDGSDNPIGKSYSKESFKKMLQPYFHIEEILLHFFPARAIPFNIPKVTHRFLDRNFGFMICAMLKKRLT